MAAMQAFPEPSGELDDPRALLLLYLDYYRAVVAGKLRGLSVEELRSSRLPSGWTPLELLIHLVHMEQRWLRWGFAAEPVLEPWGDVGADGRWAVGDADSLDELLGRLHDGGRRTRQIVEGAGLSEVAAVGGRFEADADRPSLAWICFHVLQEYARHAGHLDIVRELSDGTVGE